MYKNIVGRIVFELSKNVINNSAYFSHFICALPKISSNVNDIVFDMLANAYSSNNGGHMVNSNTVADLALDTIVDIILKRPKYTSHNLDCLLKHTCSKYDDFRQKVIFAMCYLYDREALRDKIETFANDSFCNVINTPKNFSGERPLPPSGESNDKSKLRYEAQLNIWAEKEKQLTIEYLKSHSSLFLALLTKNENLLYNQFVSVYIKCNESIQVELNKLCNEMIAHFGSTSNSAIVELIDQYCPSEGSMFVQHCAWILTNKCRIEIPSNALLNSLYNNFRRNNNPIIFQQIVPYLKKHDLDSILPAVFNQCNFDICKDFIRGLLRKRGDLTTGGGNNNNNDGGGTSLIEPADLLVKIIKFAPTVEHPHVKKMMKCVDFCMGQGLFDHSVCSITISRLIDVEPLPVLYMRVLWKSIDIFPNLSKLALNMLRRLIEKQCWKNAHIWDGFILIVRKLLPQSCDVLRLLSKKELSHILNKDAKSNNPVIIPQFKKFVSKHERSLRSYFREALNEAESLIVGENQVRIFSLKKEINQSQSNTTQNINHNNNNGATRIKSEPKHYSSNNNNDTIVKTEKQSSFGGSNDTKMKGSSSSSSSRKRHFSEAVGNGAGGGGTRSGDGGVRHDDDEPLKKRLKKSSKMKSSSSNYIGGYFLRFFVLRDGLDNYNASQKEEFGRFLQTNITQNLLKIPEGCITKFWMDKSDLNYLGKNKLSKDRYLVTAVFKNERHNNKSMESLLNELKTMLTTWDFASWQISIVQPTFDDIKSIEMCNIEAISYIHYEKLINGESLSSQSQLQSNPNKSKVKRSNDKSRHSSRRDREKDKEKDKDNDKDKDRDRDRDRDRQGRSERDKEGRRDRKDKRERDRDRDREKARESRSGTSSKKRSSKSRSSRHH